MLVIVHRWQPKTQRYQTQKFEVGQQEERVYLDMIFNKAASAVDPMQKPMIMRTQRVDRLAIEEGMNGPCITVYLSPIVERKYVEVKDDKGNVKKAKLSDVLCQCQHGADTHAAEANIVGKRICLTPGCPCSDLVIIGTRSDIIDGITGKSASEHMRDSVGTITPKQDKKLEWDEERCHACKEENCGIECSCICHSDNIPV